MDWAVEGSNVATVRNGYRPQPAGRHLRQKTSGHPAVGDLARPGVRVVVGAEDVPAGLRPAVAGSGRAGPAHGEAFRTVLANVVSLESVTIRKVLLGEADAGVVYASDAAGTCATEIPAGQNVQASYYIAPVLAGPQPDLARAFIDFVLSAEGQRILAESGLIPAGETGE